MRFSLFPLAALVSSALAAPTSSLEVRETAVQATDRLLFSSTISQFIAARNAKNPAGLDWSSDGCSSSPDNPLGFDFENSCYRHDFGYRNTKAQSRFPVSVLSYWLYTYRQKTWVLTGIFRSPRQGSTLTSVPIYTTNATARASRASAEVSRMYTTLLLSLSETGRELRSWR